MGATILLEGRGSMTPHPSANWSGGPANFWRWARRGAGMGLRDGYVGELFGCRAAGSGAVASEADGAPPAVRGGD